MMEASNPKSRMMMFAVIVLTALALVFYGSVMPGRAAASEGQEQPKKVLNVSGQGTVDAAPDIAYITLGVVTENENAKTAQQKNAEAMSAVIAKIKASGVKDEDIKTTNYSINPKYNYNQATGESRIIGYTVNNSVQVTVRDIAKTGNIIDAASLSGVNTTSNISFGLSDYDKYYNEALKQAVESARKKAQTISSTLGITLKTPVSISENGGYEPVYERNAKYGMDMAGAAATPIQSGSLTVRANVSMTYEY
jgi:hypothetical protein